LQSAPKILSKGAPISQATKPPIHIMENVNNMPENQTEAPQKKSPSPQFLELIGDLEISEQRADEIIDRVTVLIKDEDKFSQMLAKLSSELPVNEMAFAGFHLGRINNQMESNPLMGLLSALSR
jgi:hypothetical protein